MGRRGLGLGLLAVAITAGHLWLADHALPDRLGEGADGGTPRPARIDVSFVRELAPTQPPAVAPVVAPPRRAARPPPVAASLPASAAAPEPAPPEPPPPAEIVAAVPPPPAPVVEAAASAAAPPLPEAAPASAAPVAVVAAPAASAAIAEAAAAAFEWPPSTRLSYRLTGHFRGPVEGQASVEWLRTGQRYQVHLDVGVGPSFATLLSRRVSSNGEITDQGLRPRRYDEETRVLLRDPRRAVVSLDADTIRLANGQALPRPAGVQDSASQFVQLTWLFTTQPQLLQPGQSVELPLALPRSVQVWTYDVLGRETLDTPFGPVETVHVKPRREPRPGGDLTAEVWFAPSLQYLPVRLLIRQDAENYVDLLIERLPQQAAPPAATPPPPPPPPPGGPPP